MTSLVKRLWAKVQILGPDDCWPWLGYIKKDDGYGRIREGRRGTGELMVHKVAYESAKGPVPDGLELDHLCRTRHCCNPGHLEAVTHKVNMERGVAGKFHASKTHCPKGHPYSGDNLYQHGGKRHCRACRRERRRRR